MFLYVCVRVYLLNRNLTIGCLQRWWRKRTSEREREREFERRKEELEDHDKRENMLKVGRKILDWNRFSLSL